jgi:hypothetical protein
VDVPQQSTKARGLRRFWKLYLALALLLVPYFWSYFHISRMRWQEAMKFRAPGFYYVSGERIMREPEESWVPDHIKLAYFYYPANVLDRAFFGGPPFLGEPCHIGEKPKQK